tara:strand:- start:1950 stop:3392 length:1443 start_codon:yes stop_codon:yes gene_type:complete
MKKLFLFVLTASVFAQDIELKGVVSADNNQIKNIANPTDDQDAVTKGYLIEKTNELLSHIEALQSHTGYPNSLIDQDGNPYEFKTYGTQIWTLSNAEVVTYRDGTPIPQVTDATEWANLTTGAWCYYDNDPTKGKLYNWYAVAGIHDDDPNTPNKEFAPTGWHVPTDAEWTELENHLIANGYNYDGTTEGNKIAKAMSSTFGWNSTTSIGATGDYQSLNNASGFNATPEGFRIEDGSFGLNGTHAIFWSSDEYVSDRSWNRFIYFNYNYLARDSGIKQQGNFIRFIKDSEIINNTDHIPDHLEVGDLWGGGIVVNIDPTRQNATIMASREYVSPPIAFDSKAHSFSYTSPGLSNGETQDYYGADNTMELIKNINNPNVDALNEAANYCNNIIIEGYDDWYLPTRRELEYSKNNDLMYEHIYFQGLDLWTSIFSAEKAIKLSLAPSSIGYQDQGFSFVQTDKDLHQGITRALPFRKVGTIY